MDRGNGGGGDGSKGRNVIVNLRGPHHPLQYNLSAAHRVGFNKEVRVEQDSVNSGKCRRLLPHLA